MSRGPEDFWSLPGPLRYLDGVVDELRRGRSVVAALPGVLPGAPFQEALAFRIRQATFHCISLDSASIARADQPEAAFARAVGVPPRGGFRVLGDSPGLSGVVALVTSVAGPDYAFWHGAVEEFALGANQREQFERGTMCMVTSGIAASDFPRASATLEVLPWGETLDRTDLLVLASLCASGPRSLERDLRIALAVELAAGDPTLAARIACTERSHEAVLPQLLAYAGELGWTRGIPCCWHVGTEVVCDGAAAPHAAWLALECREDEIRTRCWRAQLSVIFPHLEQERLRIARASERLLRLPIDTPWGVRLTQAADLELAHLLYLLGRSVSASARGVLDDLVQARNALAHLEVVRPDILSRILQRAKTGSPRPRSRISR